MAFMALMAFWHATPYVTLLWLGVVHVGRDGKTKLEKEILDLTAQKFRRWTRVEPDRV